MTSHAPRVFVAKKTESHCDACDCAAHRKLARPLDVPGDAQPSLFATILPALACAVCPACVASYASALSAVGVSASFGEAYHHYFLALAVLVTLAVQSRRAYVTRRVRALVIATLGCTLLVVGHGLYETPVLVWAGVVVLLGGSVADVFAARRAVARERSTA